MELENYYGEDEVKDLDIWERQFNIPLREMPDESPDIASMCRGA